MIKSTSMRWAKRAIHMQRIAHKRLVRGHVWKVEHVTPQTQMGG